MCPHKASWAFSHHTFTSRGNVDQEAVERKCLHFRRLPCLLLVTHLACSRGFGIASASRRKHMLISAGAIQHQCRKVPHRQQLAWPTSHSPASMEYAGNLCIRINEGRVLESCQTRQRIVDMEGGRILFVSLWTIGLAFGESKTGGYSALGLVNCLPVS